MIAYRPDIDGLRAVAVLAVVASHAGLPGFAGGYIGVDIFFVISGYLITAILLEQQQAGTFSVIRFYERRVRRILPALIVMLAACLAAGWFLVPPPLYERMGQSGAATALFVSNLWFIRHSSGYFDPASEYDAFLHTWSLAVEEQFYIVWPLLLAATIRTAARRTAIVVALLTIVSLVHSAALVETSPKHAFFLATSRAWELGIGALLAMHPSPAPGRAWQGEALSALAAAVILCCVVLYDPATPFPGLAALPPVLATAMLVWVGAHRTTVVGRLLSSKLAVGIGLISYSLYLWHWPLLVLARLHAGSLAIGPLRAAMAVAVAFVLAWLSWRFVERPFRRAGGSAGARRGATVVAAAASLAAVAGVGVALARADGAWFRAPELRQPFARATALSAQERACWARTPAQRCPLGAGKGAAPTVLLWGDSHAAALIPGFDRELRRRGLAGEAAVLQACAPLIGAVRRGTRRAGECSGFNRDTLAYAAASRSIRTVYLAARWPLLVTGRRPEGEAGGPIVLQSTLRAQAGRGNALMVEQGLDEVVARLAAAGKRVVLLGDVPELGRDPAFGMLTAHFVGTAPGGGPALAEVRQREAAAAAILDRIADRHGAVMIDLPGLMCRTRCPVRHGPHLLYRDENHLSQYGAEKLVPLLLGQAPPVVERR